MKIKSLELVKYKRFKLNGINRLFITLTSALQLILGTNGSGKSSLLAELTPLPATPADYEPGGSKRIVIDHLNSEYILISTITKAGKHQFLKDGEELNPGGTGQVQKELVERELGFTQQLHDVLTGKLTFTNMSPSKRREWVERLSSTDLTFALGVFETVRTNTRDIVGAIKHTKGRLATEGSKLLQDTDQLDVLDGKITQWTEDLNTLLVEITPNIATPRDLGTQIQSTLAEIHTNVKTIRRINGSALWHKRLPLPQLEYRISECHDLGVKSQTEITLYTEELEKFQGILQSLSETGMTSMEELEDKQSFLMAKFQTLPAVPTEWTYPGDITVVLGDIENVHSVLSDWIDSLEYTEPKPAWDITKHREYEAAKESAANEVFLLESKLKNARQRLDIVLDCARVDCPKCLHHWKPGIVANEDVLLKDRIQDLTTQLSEQHARIKEYTEKLERYDAYLAFLRRFKVIVNAYPRMHEFWTTVCKPEILDSSPIQVIELLNAYRKALEVKQSHITVEHDLALIDTAMLQFQATAGNITLSERVRELETLIETCTAACAGEGARCKEYEAIHSMVTEYQNTIAAITTLELRVDTLTAELLESYRQVSLKEVVSRTQSELAQAQNKINARETIREIIKDLRESLSALETDYTDWVTLGKILSPSNGIIAKQLTGFITHLTGQLNTIIASVWEYPLEVLPCGIESGDLDYKFPLLVKDDHHIVPDIKLGSSAQTDIVDFAFTLIVMLYLGLEQYPLYMDETGASFDLVHRERLMDYIKLLLDTQRCSQIYLVNHYSTFSGGLSNAETAVLDASNITVPKEYNQHLVTA